MTITLFSSYIIQQIPLHLSSQRNFSSTSKPGGASASGSPGKPPESNGSLSKFFIGSVALGAAFLAAYQTGYLDQYLKKEHHSVPQEANVNATIEELKTVQHSTDQLISPNEILNNENPTVQLAEGKIDTHFSQPEDVIEDQVDKLSPVQDKFNIAEDSIAAPEENQLPEYPQSSLTSDDPSKESVVQSDGIIGIKSIEADNTPRPEKGVQNTFTSTQISSVPDENGTENIPSVQLGIQDSEEKKEVLMSWYKLDIEVNSLISGFPISFTKDFFPINFSFSKIDFNIYFFLSITECIRQIYRATTHPP